MTVARSVHTGRYRPVLGERDLCRGRRSVRGYDDDVAVLGRTDQPAVVSRDRQLPAEQAVVGAGDVIRAPQVAFLIVGPSIDVGIIAVDAAIDDPVGTHLHGVGIRLGIKDLDLFQRRGVEHEELIGRAGGGIDPGPVVGNRAVRSV